jgi:hypothetical protein
MSTPLVPLVVPSVYKVEGLRVHLPRRMARCTPDMKAAIRALASAVAERGGNLYLSDLFRSYEMQLQAYLDFASGKKSAFSPPPGGSLHEAGRALDLDLKGVKMSLAALWELTAPAGLTPIIDRPDGKASEAWHFECRGSHQLVYDHYQAGKGTNFSKPYKAMAASAILAVDVKVDAFRGKEAGAYLQSALVRLGQDIGNIDGDIGPKTRRGLAALGLAGGSAADLRAGVDALLTERFPREHFDPSTDELMAMRPHEDGPPVDLQSARPGSSISTMDAMTDGR